MFENNSDIEDLLMKFISVVHEVYEKSEGCFVGLIRNKKASYYNMDIQLFIKTLVIFLEEKGLDENSLATVRNLLLNGDSDDTSKAIVYILNTLAYIGITGQPKGNYYYYRILHENFKTKTYFEFNSVGISEMALRKFLSKDFIEEYIENFSENDVNVEVVAIGQRQVNATLKKRIINKKDVHEVFDFMD